MKNFVILLACVLCAVSAIPVPAGEESIELDTIPLGDNKELDVISLTDDSGKISERNKRTIGILRELFPNLSQATVNDAINSLDAQAITSQLDTIRVARATAIEQQKLEQLDQPEVAEQKNAVSIDDQQPAESNSPALDELSLDNDELDENRDKRFLNFGFGGSAGTGQGAAAGGSGGSGNFLFDIIRRTADRAARAAGTVYRVVAGTESLGVNISASHRTSLLQPPQSPASGQSPVLVAGGSGTEQTDEKANAPDAGAATPGGDGYTEGIPGPVTRLFVLANRGLSNLIQDLILRIAQTSERVVNFKARLITSLI